MTDVDARAWAAYRLARRLGEVVVDQADLEEQARQLERRAVDADEAVARAVEARSRPCRDGVRPPRVVGLRAAPAAAARPTC